MSNREIVRLEKQISYHNNKYFQENDPQISDKEYDSLVERLRELDPKNSLLELVEDSKNFKEFRKVNREKPMLSLQKVYELEPLNNWLNQWLSPVCVMPKVDGCAVEIRYDAVGNLELAATRGDGTVGEDVTANILQVNDVPREFPFGGFEVRGEVYMSQEVFGSFPEGKFSNPRNAAAGGLRQKDPFVTREYNLSFVAYDVINKGGLEDMLLGDEYHKFHLLASIGFIVVPHKFFRFPGLIINPETFKKEFLREMQTRNLTFPMDGLVYKVSDLKEQVGYTSHHPKYAVAYKFEDEKYKTVLEDIVWQVSRSGRINPVAIFKPVDIDGVKVSKASLHSLKMFLDFCPAIGSVIEVSRRGGVIPYIESILERKGEPVLVPEVCPRCGHDTKVLGEFLYCELQDSCNAAIESFLVHFAKSFGIDGLGPEFVKIMYQNKIVKTPKDFYTLREEDLFDCGIGPRICSKIINSIEESKKGSVPKLLASMNIPGLGLRTAKEIWSTFGEFIFNAHVLDIESVSGVGSKKAKDIWDGIQERRDDLAFIMQFLDCKEGVMVNSLGGKSFLFTGTLSSPRKELEELVEHFGGVVAGSVNKKLDYLVTGEMTNESSKLKKAKSLNVSILNEKEFLELFED